MWLDWVLAWKTRWLCTFRRPSSVHFPFGIPVWNRLKGVPLVRFMKQTKAWKIMLSPVHLGMLCKREKASAVLVNEACFKKNRLAMKQRNLVPRSREPGLAGGHSDYAIISKKSVGADKQHYHGGGLTKTEIMQVMFHFWQKWRQGCVCYSRCCTGKPEICLWRSTGIRWQRSSPLRITHIATYCQWLQAMNLLSCLLTLTVSSGSSKQ